MSPDRMDALTAHYIQWLCAGGGYSNVDSDKPQDRALGHLYRSLRAAYDGLPVEAARHLGVAQGIMIASGMVPLAEIDRQSNPT